MRSIVAILALALVSIGIAGAVFPIANGALRRALASARPALAEVAGEPVPPVVHGDDWPGFRGPGGTGISATGKPPAEWGDDRNLAWKADLPGGGSSSPIVVGDLVIVLCYTGTDGGNLSLHLVEAVGDVLRQT